LRHAIEACGRARNCQLRPRGSCTGGQERAIRAKHAPHFANWRAGSRNSRCSTDPRP
jgi:hypothetical protein